ncbi:MAG: hypothetical protein ABJO67_19755 [Pseudoruegeria sp.]
MSQQDPTLPQQKLMASWPGQPVDKNGILRVLNESGSKTPILWIFNGANEPEILAKSLGEDQPLFFSRSMHLIVQPNDDRDLVRKVLTDYLFKELCLHLPGVKLDMGANCQGAGMLMGLSILLRARDIDVERLFLINCRLPDVPTNLPALLIYGDQDQQHDPFRSNPKRANERAMKLFSSYQRVMINAQHGRYFTTESIEEIVDRMMAFRSSLRL